MLIRTGWSADVWSDSSLSGLFSVILNVTNQCRQICILLTKYVIRLSLDNKIAIKLPSLE